MLSEDDIAAALQRLSRLPLSRGAELATFRLDMTLYALREGMQSRAESLYLGALHTIDLLEKLEASK